MQQIKNGYIECMLWADSLEDDQGEEIDFNGISEALSSSITDDIEKFISLSNKLIDEALEVDNYYLENIGHDFWLTRNGHGSGFWDGDIPYQLGDKLTAIAEGFKTFDLWVDNGQLQGEQI